MPFCFSLSRRAALLLLGLTIGCSGDTAAPVSQDSSSEPAVSSETDVAEFLNAKDAEHVLATALSTAGEDKNVLVHLGGPG